MKQIAKYNLNHLLPFIRMLQDLHKRVKISQQEDIQEYLYFVSICLLQLCFSLSVGTTVVVTFMVHVDDELAWKVSLHLIKFPHIPKLV